MRGAGLIVPLVYLWVWFTVSFALFVQQVCQPKVVTITK